MALPATEVVKDLYWVGVFDDKLRVFDIVMSTPYGTTYNAYLLRSAEGIVLFETCKEGFEDEYIARIRQIMKPDEKVKYVVLNHTEPDHSGAISRVMAEFPDATIVATAVAHGNITNIAHGLVAKKVNATAGLELSLGNYTLKFFPSPLIHWPDTMITYIPELKTILPCDFLGAHYCNNKLFNDLIMEDAAEVAKMWDAFEYYYNAIFGPFKSFANAALDKIEKLDVEVVCCSHGPILRKDIPAYIAKYREWSKEPVRENVVVIAWTAAYGYTAHMAEAVKEGVEAAGFKAVMVDLLKDKPETVLAQANNVKGIMLGTPTLIGDAVPPVWAIATGLNPFIHKGLACATFGSYGWSGEGPKNIHQRFQQLRLKVPVEPYMCKFKPTDAQKTELKEWAGKFVAALK